MIGKPVLPEWLTWFLAAALAMVLVVFPLLAVVAAVTLAYEAI